ncbi:cysteine--tRNA ligase [Nonomuraea sp. WAC 01424]|uniref:CysS/YqeB C-terminal domain-containing protein n=1 Tax=Nonomuraea sp. WAC 01424 TaxID=2203200 RepID=UPI000F79F968|nr:cysteine--tRNA ligase [Nonomuraea sp. WAC 01424]RSN08596.1 cysteine--tRNA ligase [Nonomuraea sp. WAC 01424]
MLRIYDTRAGRIEEFPGGRAVRVYTCGPAVRRRAHVGDLRTYVLSDLIRRVLERRRTRVVVCRNLIDADSGSGGPDRGHEDVFRDDSAALNLRPPEHTPRAGEPAGLTIELIAKLVERGHAYAAPDGSVYFDVRTFPAYGEISGKRLDELEPADPHGRFHADWAMWRPADGEPGLDAPWGRGLPGPHVECSALSLRFLGERVDLHVGSADLLFPQHEEERAQSDAATGHEVVRHWVHGGRVLFDGHEMAGSAGDAGAAVPLSDVAAAGLDPLAVRLAFLEHHYRQPLDLTWDTLRAADRTVRRWRARVAEWSESPSAPMASSYAERVEAAFDDDLDTPAALRILRELEEDESVAAGSKFETFLHLDQVLALDLSTEIGKPRVLPAGAGELLDRRARARETSDWAAADRLRDELAELGVTVTDTPEGQSWAL